MKTMLCRFFRRSVLAAFFILTCALYAEDSLLDPAKTIEADGSIALTDGSSYYIFSKGGDFNSGPLGPSGRTLEGSWREEKGRFVVIAKRGWLDGLATPTFHRIVFTLGAGMKKPLRTERIPAIMEFATYFLIEEFVEIPDPSLEAK